MNKRIEHLFNEAGFHKPEAERLGIEHKFEKFAELIVRECAKIAAKEQDFNDCHEIHVNIDQCILMEFGL